MEQTPVGCGWKGCENSFATTEGMNIHVQADHMVYRVLMQTEYQGRTHLNAIAVAPAYEQQQQLQLQQPQAAANKQGLAYPRSTEETSPPQRLQYESATQQPRPVITAPQPAKASAATGFRAFQELPAVAAATIPAFAPITMKQEVIEEEEEVVEEEPAFVPMNVVSSGALILTPRAQIRMEAAIATESQELEEGGGGITPPSASAIRKRAGSSGMGGGGASRAKKTTGRTSKYWVYTDHMSYQCRHYRCGAEFSTAEAARHHFNANHVAVLSSSNEESASSSAAATAAALTNTATSMSSRKAAPKKKQSCPHAGCKSYFMSRQKLVKHIDVQHGTEIKPMPHEQMDEEEFEEEEILSDYERGDDNGEEELEDEVFQFNDHTVDNKNNNNGDNSHVVVFP